jgi:alkylation response protein AidB-like acyl-CoA dehydrogenase
MAMHPFDLFGIPGLIEEEERDMQRTVRQVLYASVRPNLQEWYDTGQIPARELAKELGGLGLLGMHLEGYGCAGTSATAYGLACLELEAADSGIRSLVSVQGSLAMFAIHRWGSEEQKQRWLPAMAAGDAIGCFGLTEPDFGSNPAGMRTTARRDGEDWILNGTKMWITNSPVADVAVVWAQTDRDAGSKGIRGFVVPTDIPGFSAPEIKGKLSLRASLTGETRAGGRPAARRRPMLPEAGRSVRAAVVPERSALRDRLRRARRRPGLPGDDASSYVQRPGDLRQAAGRPTRSPRPSWPTWPSSSARACCWLCTWAA